LTFCDFSRRNLQTPQTPKQKTNPKQALTAAKNNWLFFYQKETCHSLFQIAFKQFSNSPSGQAGNCENIS
jgi:hypothetical protein